MVGSRGCCTLPLRARFRASSSQFLATAFADVNVVMAALMDGFEIAMFPVPAITIELNSLDRHIIPYFSNAPLFRHVRYNEVTILQQQFSIYELALDAPMCL
jgi:hypothetical protein